jgi:hypothetical protein
VESDFNKILDFETNGIIIRSRCRWTEEGERSSKYFCNLEKRISEKKNINRIEIEGRPVTDKKVILDEIHNFYSNLYSIDHNLNFNYWSNDVNNFLNSLDIPKLAEIDKKKS